MDSGRVANRSKMFKRGVLVYSGGRGKFWEGRIYRCWKRGHILKGMVDSGRASHGCLKGVYYIQGSEDTSHNHVRGGGVDLG